MKIVFAGTPEFAQVALQALLAQGFEVPLVLTQPDRPAGRGMRLQASPVKQLAQAHGIEVAQPRSLRLDGKYPDDAAAARDALEAAGADAMVVAAYGLLLPQWVLDRMQAGSGGRPGWGCLNIHASLLPRWRGAAPIHRAIEAGDRETGITIMQMDAGLDTGAMLLRKAVPIEAHDTTGSLHDRLATLGGELIVQALKAPQDWTPVPQPADGVTYAAKIDKAESALDWRLPVRQLDGRVRAFDPFPGASTWARGEALKVWRAVPEAQTLPAGVLPGQVLQADAQGVCVAAGDGVLRVLELQRAGGKRLPAADFLRGFDLPVGTVLGTAKAP